MLKKQSSSENLHNKRFQLFLSVLESLPLPAFLVYIQLIERNSSKDWLGPYLLSTLLSLVAAVVLYFFKRPLNRIFIGIYCYFLSGLIGVVFGIAWLNQWYGVLGATGMLLWVALVFIVLLAFSGDLYGRAAPGWRDKPQFPGMAANLGFVSLAILCVCVSWWWRGCRILSEMVPFMIIFTAYGMLRSKAETPL